VFYRNVSISYQTTRFLCQDLEEINSVCSTETLVSLTRLHGACVKICRKLRQCVLLKSWYLVSDNTVYASILREVKKWYISTSYWGHPTNVHGIITRNTRVGICNASQSQVLWIYSHFCFSELTRYKRFVFQRRGGWQTTHFSYYTNRSMISPEWIVHHLFFGTTNITRYKRQNK
jgi:hypothetical protein